MKVLNVMFTTRKGGLEQAFLDYTEAMKFRNYEVISIIHKNSAIKEEVKNQFYEVANFSKHDPIALLKLWMIVRKEKPDLIITHGNRAHYMMKKIAGKVLVVGVSHVYSFDQIKKCDYIISVSQDMRKSLIHLGYKEKNIVHIPNMIKVDEKLKYSPKSLKNPPVIAIMCRLEKTKGVDIFVEALGILKKQDINFQAIIAGEGPEKENINNQIKKLNLENHIKFVGWIQDKEKFYQNIDIICMPSRQEPFGLIALEAFCYSRPLIVSNLPGPLEVVENNKDALVFDVNNHHQLANQIVKIIKDTEFSKKLTHNGWEKAHFYKLENISLTIDKFLKKITLKENE